MEEVDTDSVCAVYWQQNLSFVDKTYWNRFNVFYIIPQMKRSFTSKRYFLDRKCELFYLYYILDVLSACESSLVKQILPLLGMKISLSF